MRGLAMPNLGDIDAQSLAGALATGTHGTGTRLPNLSGQVERLELVLADGSERTIDGGDELLAARVSLGALGVIAAVTLRCVPAFRLRHTDKPEPLRPRARRSCRSAPTRTTTSSSGPSRTRTSRSRARSTARTTRRAAPVAPAPT